jgi:hypothetical protein
MAFESKEYQEMIEDVMSTILTELKHGKRIVIMVGQDKMCTITPDGKGRVIVT